MNKRLHLSTMAQISPVDAMYIMEGRMKDLNEVFCRSLSHDPPEHRRRYVQAVKRLDALHVALGGEPGCYVPLHPDASACGRPR